MRARVRPAALVTPVVLLVAAVTVSHAGSVVSRAVTIQRWTAPGARGGEVFSRAGTLLGLGAAGLAAEQALSRPATLQALGVEGPPSAPVLSREATVQRWRMPSPPSAPVIARAFTVFKDGGTADVPPVDSRPLTFVLRPASPNPVHRAARLEYELADARPVRLELIDASGRRIRTLARSASQPAGRYVVEWDGTGDDGTPVPAGIYWLRLVAGSFDQSRKVVLLRD